jgi:hypothetical protein
MANFLLKVLPDYTAERQPKTEVHQSVAQAEIPSMVTPKRDRHFQPRSSTAFYYDSYGLLPIFTPYKRSSDAIAQSGITTRHR